MKTTKNNYKNKESKNYSKKLEGNRFEWLIWTVFALENWILDFGRPIAMVSYWTDFLT
jgi:hypothetical protein